MSKVFQKRPQTSPVATLGNDLIRISSKASQACSASSGLFSSFLSKGCRIGSLVWLHKLSCQTRNKHWFKIHINWNGFSPFRPQQSVWPGGAFSWVRCPVCDSLWQFAKVPTPDRKIVQWMQSIFNNNFLNSKTGWFSLTRPNRKTLVRIPPKG